MRVFYQISGSVFFGVGFVGTEYFCAECLERLEEYDDFTFKHPEAKKETWFKMAIPKCKFNGQWFEAPSIELKPHSQAQASEPLPP